MKAIVVLIAKLLVLVVLAILGWISREMTMVKEIVHILPADSFCDSSLKPDKVVFNPTTFWDDLKTLLDDKEFASAAWLLSNASMDQLVPQRGRSYCAVPGASGNGRLFGVECDYDHERDFLMPEAPGDYCRTYFLFCYRFSEEYNTYVNQLFPDISESSQNGE